MTKKLTIEEMRRIARDHGGSCLSTEYVNAMSKLKWQCSKGHERESSPAYVKQGTWCPYCKYESLNIQCGFSKTKREPYGL